MKFKDPMCKSQLSFNFVLLALLLTATQSGFAADPLGFSNNFFVTGDYIVAGAYNMNQKFTTINGNSYAVGTINVPDASPKGVKNLGITGATSVPLGAQIVAALLYWQTVEKVGVAPGAPGSGQNGYFRPLLYQNSLPAPGYAISGANVSGSTTVSWSSGGCGGGSTGKVLRTYRADVAGGLPNDANGNPTANGSFEVRLPSVGNATPLTLGATLVVIYRIPSGAGMPSVPLNAIVIYDGDYSQSNAQLTMTQPLQGFYDADANPVSRLTHIVGSGQSNKFQTVYLGKDAKTLTPLPSLYPKLPAFPGWYGTWDNPTWTFDSFSKNPSNPIIADFSSATTQVVPSMSNQGCVSWGAVIMSTTVKNLDNDGILYSWKTNQGYCDASLNNGVCSGPGDPAWVDLTGAAHNQQDVFLQYDYMCSTISSGSCAKGGNDYSFDPRLAVDTEDSLTPPHANAVDKVVAAYANHSIHLHPIAGNAILEDQPNVGCKDTDTDPVTGAINCPFPNEKGTVGFRYGLENIKDFSIDTQTGRIGECTPGPASPTCAPAVFQPGKKDSYHYALFSDGVGVPNWYLFDGSLSSVSQTGHTVTFTTPPASPHGIKKIVVDNVCPAGRVTVLFAVTNPNLNGTFCIKNVTANTFDITVPGSPTPTKVTYNANAEPNLAVADGQVTSMSGFSDVAGQNLVVALGYGGWGPANVLTSDGNKWQTKAGTLMHELGHNMGHTHGGTFYNNFKPQANPPVIDYTPFFEVNCKSNVQTSMSYLFQFDLMQVPGGVTNAAGHPLMVVDYSEDGSAPTLTEGQTQGPNLLNLHYANTASFQLPTNNSGAPHCNGSPLAPGEKSLTYVQFSPTSEFFSSIGTGFDMDFNGNTTDVMHAHDEWEGTQAGIGVGPSPGVDLQQISAIGTLATSGAGGGHLSGGSGGGHLSGGSGGGHLSGGSGGGHISGGSGGGHISGGSGGGSEFTHEAANSYPRPPRSLTITQEEASPRYIDLSWFEPTFGTVVQYNIYLTVVGTPFPTTPLTSVPGTQTTFTDTVSCNTVGYEYRVTAVVNNDAVPPLPLESSPSNIVPASGESKLTGCYTVSNFTVPPSAVQGTMGVQITWTLMDDFYVSPGTPWASAISTNPVTRLAANTLVATGPRPGNCTMSGRTTLVADGVVTATGVDMFTNNNSNNFTFTWNNTDAFCAGSYTFELDLDHVNGGPAQTQPGPNALRFQIDVGDGDPHVNTTTLPDANVGVSYSNQVSQDGGVGTVIWSSNGLLPPGISLNSGTGVLSGTPTAGGIFTFTVTATDSNSSTGSQTLTLRVLRDVVVVDGTVAAQAGTLLRVTPGATPTTSTLASLSNGQPSAVAMDRATGSIYVAITGSTARIARVSSGGVLMDTFVAGASSGGVLTSPVAVAVDSSDNLYVGDNSLHAIYKFNSSGSQVDANGNSTVNAFATLPIPASANNIRMTFDSAGNLIVASDAIGGSGIVEVDQIPTSGVGAGMLTVLYNTSSKPGTGSAIVSVGGVAVLSDGSIAVADNMAHAIYKIANPGPMISTAIAATNDLCCNITGLTNPPSAMDTTLYLTVNGATGGAPRVVLAVPETNSVSPLFSGSPLTFPNDITWFQPQVTYYVDGLGNFGTLDLTTGVVKVIGNGTAAGNTGMDLTPTGQIYTYVVTQPNPPAVVQQLLQLNPSTGAATVVGSGTLPNPGVTTTGGLTNGSYFGIDAVSGNLYSINLASGATTSPGHTTTAVFSDPNCAFETTMAGSANTLYYSIGFSNKNSGPSCSSPMPDTLYQIDPTSGATTTIGPITIGGVGVNRFVGSAFVGGTLYAFTGGQREFTINLTTGAATLVTNTTTIIFGAASSGGSVF